MVKLNPIKMEMPELKSELELRNIDASKNLQKQKLVVLLTSALKQEGAMEDEGSFNEDSHDVQPGEADQENEEEMQTGDSVIQLTVDSTQDQSQVLTCASEEMKTSESIRTTEVEKRTGETMDTSIPSGHYSRAVLAEKETTSTGEGAKEEKATREERQRDGEGKGTTDLSSDRKKSSENDGSLRKRRHDDRHRNHDERCPPTPEEPEEEFEDSLVVLDKYNIDLNMKLLNNRCTGQTFSMEGFAYLWAGAKATHGVKSGKICYECKISEYHSVRHLSSAEPNRHLVRVGWSTRLSGLQLGEEEFSYAYCGTGKVVTYKNAEEYGELFKEGDVIGCYIDFSGDDEITMSFAKNGISLGVGFTVEKAKLADNALFPHVLCKNVTVELNFGQKVQPYFTLPEDFKDYVFLASVPEEQRIRGATGASTQKECEVLMLVGLPGAGKTYWAKNHVENSQKKYIVLGMNAIIERMKVTGLEHKTPQRVLMMHASDCLDKLTQIASKKKRNFILDPDTNVSSSAQRRNMQPFVGYKRKAIVIVPSDEEYKSRLKNRSEEETGEISDVAMYQMKGSFAIPEVGDQFEEVLFPELNKEEVMKLIEEYREEARENGPPVEKRSRGGFGGGYRFDNRTMGGRAPFCGVNVGRSGNQRMCVLKDGASWQQNRDFDGGRGGFRGANRGGYGGKQSGGFNNSQQKGFEIHSDVKSGAIHDQDQQHPRNRAGTSIGETKPFTSMSPQYPASQQQSTSLSSQYHQGYNAHSQPDYSQQWAQYYQQQATIQQQPAAVTGAIAQHQNHYTSYQTIYGDSDSAVM